VVKTFYPSGGWDNEKPILPTTTLSPQNAPKGHFVEIRPVTGWEQKIILPRARADMEHHTAVCVARLQPFRSAPGLPLLACAARLATKTTQQPYKNHPTALSTLKKNDYNFPHALHRRVKHLHKNLHKIKSLMILPECIVRAV